MSSYKLYDTISINKITINSLDRGVIMRFTQTLTTLFVSLCFICFITTAPALGFIEREYTIREVLDACTNIVFGEIESVNKTRYQTIVKVNEDLKGKSSTTELKFNLATGHYKQGSSPQKLVRLLKPGMPIIVFYRASNYGVDSMCFIDKTWFQMRGYNRRSQSSWWSFTHIDPMMSRTFDGKTVAFQKVVRDMLDGKMWVMATDSTLKAYVLTGNSTSPTWGQTHLETNSMTYEYQALRNIKKIGKRPVAFEYTKVRTLPHLKDADILWIGYEEISSYGRYLLSKNTEQAIKDYVKNGGIVVVSGQDSTPNKPCGIGWLDGKLKGVESPPKRVFIKSENADELFSTPNKIQSGKIYIDDAWTEWQADDEIFATTPDTNELVVGARKYGNGLYIITSLRNDNQYTVSMNKALMENILHFAASKIQK